MYHTHANWRVVALTNESGAVVERYDYTAYGEPTIFVGVPGAAGGSGAGGESGHSLLVSSVGNPLMHQGLFRDDESGTYQNRFRQLHSRSGRFMQRDPAEITAAYAYLESRGPQLADPLGLDEEATDAAIEALKPKNRCAARKRDGLGLTPEDKYEETADAITRELTEDLIEAGVASVDAADTAATICTGGISKAVGELVACAIAKAATKVARARAIARALNVVRNAAGVASSKPVRKGVAGKTKWWLHEVFEKSGKKKLIVIVEHTDGSVHAGTPKQQWLDGDFSGPPKYHETHGIHAIR